MEGTMRGRKDEKRWEEGRRGRWMERKRNEWNEGKMEGRNEEWQDEGSHK
jgi:hypothetical protein